MYYSTVSYGYLFVFCIAKGIKCHDIYLIQCCLIHLYVVLNLERFLHVYVIPSIALFETSASVRNVPHVAHVHTHAHFLAFCSDRQRGQCIISLDAVM